MTSAMMKNHSSRRWNSLFLILAVSAPYCCHAIIGANAVQQKKRAKGRKNNLVLAESFDSMSMVRANPAAPQAGDYFVWDNNVWSFDLSENVPTRIIGMSKGTCFLLEDNNAGAGLCTFTLTIKEEPKDDAGDEEKDPEEAEDDKDDEPSKLMIMGDVDSLEWDSLQTLAIVGGTGKYEAAAGVIDIIAESGFLLYEVFLD